MAGRGQGDVSRRRARGTAPCVSSARRLAALLTLALLASILAACGPAPSPTTKASATLAVIHALTATPSPSVITAATATRTATTAPAPSATATASATPAPSPTMTVTETPSPTASPRPATPSPSPTAVLTATPQPDTPTPAPETRKPVATVSIRYEQVTIPAYPYERYLTPVTSPTYTLTFPRLDWDAYTAAAPALAPRTFTGVVLENAYLRLTILPDLGGRLYSAVFKPTGRDLFYRNPVLKPAHWGHDTQGWWLGAGGMEWCLPVNEHGYEWGVPWEYSTAQGQGEASVTLWDTAASNRIRARVTITLSAGRAAFTVSPLIENPTGQPISYQFWLNAMLALGGGNRVTEATEFILPTGQVTVHSTGDRTLPQPGQAMSWPIYNGRALNLYGTWRYHLGIFERPRGQSGFAGAYDHASGDGVLRIYPPETAQGVKLFASKGLDADQWTDDGSTYFEIHGGVTPTFWDNATLAPGAALSWSEQWYPYQAIGPANAANADAALTIAAVQDGYRLGAAVTRALSGRLALVAGGKEVWAQAVALSPDQPLVVTAPVSAGGVTLRLEDEQGQVILEAALQ